MKTAITSFALIFCLLLSAQAQRNFTQKVVTSRINLNEKANRGLFRVPDMMLNAYRLGKIQGYYPNTVDAAMPFAEFAKRFRLPPEDIDARGEFECCSPRSISEEELLQSVHYPEFSTILDLIEIQAFNKETSAKTYETLFVRLCWIDPSETIPSKNGILFKYEDVATFLSDLKLPNYKNEATELSFPQYVDLRNFSTYIIDLSGYAPITLEEAKQRKDKRTEKEGQNWDR